MVVSIDFLITVFLFRSTSQSSMFLVVKDLLVLFEEITIFFRGNSLILQIYVNVETPGTVRTINPP
jgi:hypothetical protein